MSQQTPSASGVSYVRIGADRAGQRLDNFLIVHLKGVPKSRIYRIIRDGQVRVNKKRAKQTTRLEEGDEVRIPPIRTSEEPVAPAVGQGLAERLARSLVYEDKYLLVYNKPAGLAVHGGSGVSLGLIETLRALRPTETSLELVHRLDRDTSGLIMVARHRPFLRRLQRLMQDGKVEKRYWLLCQGFKGQARTVEAPLLKMQQGNERIVRVSRDGKPSLTEFRLVERLNGFQLVEATLGTGRTHQIRVHAQHAGFPLLGDSKYGNPSVNNELAARGITRLCLHARSLRFRHPETGEQLDLQAPLDEAFEQALLTLREKGNAAVSYRLVIFDWDGTLMDSTGRIVSCMQAAAADMALPALEAVRARQIIGLGLPEAISTLYPVLSRADVLRMRDHYARHFIAAEQTPSALYPGARELLDTLQARDHLLAVATGKSRKGLARVWENSGLGDYFHYSRCADESGSKPDPRMLHDILERLDVPVSQAVMIGDTSFDLEMAQRAGMDRIAVTHGAHDAPVLAAYQPLAMCDHLDQVLSLLTPQPELS